MTPVADSAFYDERRDPLVRRRVLIIGGLSLALVIASIVALGTGPLAIAPLDVLVILASGLGLAVQPDELQSAVILSVRLPRIVLAVASGAILGVSGAALQALFRNPLADPELVGVSGGAACGAVAWIIFGAFAPLSLVAAWSMPIAAFLAGSVTTFVVYVVARSGPRADVATLLLTGLAMKALTGAILGYLIYLGSEQQVRALSFWLLGSLGGSTWDTLIPALILMAVAFAMFIPLARPFDVMALGEVDASRLGVPVERVKTMSIAAVALGVGSSVALTGAFGFVGLLAPHLVRLLGGSNNRFVVPGAALMGALLVTLADLIARTAVAPAELPIGVVTSALGAPFFFWLLRGRMRAGWSS
jgi:iron complex transport system permease protein